MENTERELISHNEELLKTIFSDLKAFVPALNKVKDAYGSLQLKSKFNDSILKELITKGIGRIAQVYMDELNSQLDKSGLTNANLRAVALQNTDYPLNVLRTAIQELKEVNPVSRHAFNPRQETLTLNFISFENEVFIITDVDKEAIAEKYCRVYLEDSRSKEMYDSLKEVQNALQHYVTWMADLGLPRGIYGGSFTDNLDQFFIFNQDTSELTINPNSISWALAYKAERERMANIGRR